MDTIYNVGRFESDVISDGTQTRKAAANQLSRFESDVISDGTQTTGNAAAAGNLFESDVISDGTQTALFVIKMQNSFK